MTKFTSTCDKVMVVFGYFFSMLQGLAMPCMMLFIEKMLDSFGDALGGSLGGSSNNE